MSPSVTPHPQNRVIAFETTQSEISLTGRLVGLDLPARDALLARLFESFERDLATAQGEARRSGQPVAFEAAAISLTDGGDTCWVHPDGTLDREYSVFAGYERCLEQAAAPPPLDPSRPVHPEKLLHASYTAFWAPSATNWQPTRVLECSRAQRLALQRVLGVPLPLCELPWLITLRREHYESLLGDVLEPFGLHVTAREESIDAGIFAHTLRLAVLSGGLTLQERVFDSAERLRLVPLVRDILREAQTAEACPMASEKALADLIGHLETGHYLPDGLFIIGHPAAPFTPWPPLPALVTAHSTQRVASPRRRLDVPAFSHLWDVAHASLPAEERKHVRWVHFSREQKVPQQIGAAMHVALYGGHEKGGLLEAMTLGRYLNTLQQRQSGAWQNNLPSHWHDLPETELRSICRELPVETAWLGSHLRERLFRDGKYHNGQGQVLDERGRPLTLPLLVRLLKGLAGTFGHFFLKFQNTHPQNAVLLADTRQGEPHVIWRSVGRLAATLTWAARAEGLSSIIKTGPIDLAGDAIAQILAANPDGCPILAGWENELEARRLYPALTFQVGYPLGLSDTVESGTGDAHSGLEERRRDKRPPRAHFSHHHWAAPNL